MDEEPKTSAPEDSPVRQPMPRGLYTWAILGVVLAGPILLSLTGWAYWKYRQSIIEKRKQAIVGALLAIAGGQNTRPGDYDGNFILEYASNYRDLYYELDANGRPVAKISKELADACGPNGKPYKGYLFCDMTAHWQTGPYNWQYEFGFCAWPAKYGKSGKATYITSADGSIYQRDRGPKAGPITTYPDTSVGWILVH